MAKRQTRNEILAAAERLLVAATNIDDVSVRRIATAAGVNIAAIGYHFGSRERLLIAAIKRVYDRFNAERLALLEAAIAARAPRPPDLAAIITALIAPSIRWSNDPTSSYAAFINFGALMERARDPIVRNTMAHEIKHLRAFIAPLRQAAPWFGETDIAWRIHCALGVRHNVVRYRARAAALVGDAIDLRDSEEVLQCTVEVIVPMFARPAGNRQVPQQANAIHETMWRRASVLLISHNMRDVVEVARRALILSGGRKVRDEQLAGWTADKLAAAVMGAAA